jgi:hypothetical protein
MTPQGWVGAWTKVTRPSSPARLMKKTPDSIARGLLNHSLSIHTRQLRRQVCWRTSVYVDGELDGGGTSPPVPCAPAAPSARWCDVHASSTTTTSHSHVSTGASHFSEEALGLRRHDGPPGLRGVDRRADREPSKMPATSVLTRRSGPTSCPTIWRYLAVRGDICGVRGHPHSHPYLRGLVRAPWPPRASGSPVYGRCGPDRQVVSRVDR